MSCELCRQFALDQNWDQATRRRAVETLQHLETCAECQQAILDYDRLRQTLGTFVTKIDPPAGWDDFTRHVSMPAPRRESSAGLASFSRSPSRWRIAWTGIAASIFIAACVAFEMGQAVARPVSVEHIGASLAADHAFSPRELPRELDAFSQISSLFDGRTGWMLMSDTASDFGLAASSQGLGHDVLLLRLTLTHGPELTSNADLLVIPGQAANFTVAASHGPSLRYRVRTNAADPSRVALSLELTSPNMAEPLAALATNLQLQPGEKLTAGRLVTAYGEYELNISFAYAGLLEGAPR